MAAKKGEKNPKRLKNGEAKLQFFANVEEIQQLASEYYSMAAIHKKLTREGKITMGLTTFKEYCKPDDLERRRRNKRKK